VESSAQSIQASVREEAKRFIPKIASANDIYKLFQLLKYPGDKLFDSSYKRDIDEFDFKKDERDKIKAVYTVFSYGRDLPIFLVEATTTSHAFLKYVTRVLADRYLRFLLVATSDYEQIVFVLPDYERVETGKHKLRIAKLVVDKDDLYYTDLETIANIAFRGEASWRDLWKKWRDAFDVEKVTEQFFLDYQGVFFKVRSAVAKQRIATKDAQEFTLQLLNRIMFIYFVSKKRWLNNDPKFMRWFWNRYLLERNKGKVAKDSFYGGWLTIIFFEAFNNSFRNSAVMPDDVKKALRDAPYLNGGLFRKSDLDKLSIRVSDDLFKEVFQFFERYNFTIREDLLDAEVAVDPQMIGYVYESLANVAESSYEREEDLRGAWGIFYTPRVEVEFMCKRALVEYLANHMPQVPKEKLYELVFDDDKEKAGAFFEKQKLWYDLEELLDNISVVDPACGSGAFLVGMANVLSEIYRVVYRHIKRDLTDFELKNKIVMRSLYGVDVMPWAVHAAELRLWLQLIVESDLRPDDLKAHPLLPNLNMNLRIGDSLVQEVGGINLHVRDPAISPRLKQRLVELKVEKERYFNNDPTAKFKNKEDLETEEIRIFAEVIKDRVDAFSDERAKLFRKLQELERGIQKDLYGKVIKTPSEQLEPIKARLLEAENQIATLDKVAKTLHDPEKKPFAWEIGFAEIFGEKGGFDIVIGNPPYVRQEDIAPPTRPRAELSNYEKREYKDKLIESVRAHLPVVERIDRKSDYYVYFYFHGIALLNSKGTFCFITSNAWLDVGYGTELQEFLLKYVPIKAIYDNPKRSFAHADINTVIVVFGPLSQGDKPPSLLNPESYPKAGANKWPALTNIARFVMFKKPFEEVTTSKVLFALETLDKMEDGADCRVYPLSQMELLAEGWEYPEDYDEGKEGRFKQGRYEGNKWGGKYLRAHDIFFTVLAKGKGKLVKLSELAKIFPGCYTGINDFFYVREEVAKQWGIEQEFLVPIIRNTEVADRLRIDSTKGHYVVGCNASKAELRRNNRKGMLNYVLWGERQRTRERQKTKAGIPWPQVETVKNRKPGWWAIPPHNLSATRLFMLYVSNDRFFCPYAIHELASDRCFHRLFPKPNVDTTLLAALLNSSLEYLFVMLLGRWNLGEGALKFETTDAKKLRVVNPSSLGREEQLELKDALENLGKRRALSVYEELGISPTRPIREQTPHPLPDRRKLDDVIFNVLGLTEQERKEVYWSVCELVKARLDKAKSLKKRR